MKQRELIKKLNGAGFELADHGGNHDIYKKGSKKIAVPRHKEIKENMAKVILKEAGLI